MQLRGCGKKYKEFKEVIPLRVTNNERERERRDCASVHRKDWQRHMSVHNTTATSKDSDQNEMASLLQDRKRARGGR
jgi:hypothetical protein